jgi:ligand-binding SRPBCC domain-containing protein
MHTTDAYLQECEPCISRNKNEYTLVSRARVQRPLAEVFPFFSNPRNLERITPSMLRFRIIGDPPSPITEGALIDYKLRIRGLSIRWRSCISTWEPPHRFVDTQLRGPYRQWIHEHQFYDEGESTMMQDTIRYKVRGGRLINHFFVKKDVLKIFRYRTEYLRDHFENDIADVKFP